VHLKGVYRTNDLWNFPVHRINYGRFQPSLWLEIKTMTLTIDT